MHLRSLKRVRGEVSLYDPIGVDREGNEITLVDVPELPRVGTAARDRGCPGVCFLDSRGSPRSVLAPLSLLLHRCLQQGSRQTVQQPVPPRRFPWRQAVFDLHLQSSGRPTQEARSFSPGLPPFLPEPGSGFLHSPPQIFLMHRNHPGPSLWGRGSFHAHSRMGRCRSRLTSRSSQLTARYSTAEITARITTLVITSSIWKTWPP